MSVGREISITTRLNGRLGESPRRVAPTKNPGSRIGKLTRGQLLAMIAGNDPNGYSIIENDYDEGNPPTVAQLRDIVRGYIADFDSEDEMLRFMVGRGFLPAAGQVREHMTRRGYVSRANPRRRRSTTVQRLRALARRGVTLAELSLGQKMEQAEHKLGATTSLAIAIDHLEEHGPGWYLKSRRNPVRRDRQGRFR